MTLYRVWFERGSMMGSLYCGPDRERAMSIWQEERFRDVGSKRTYLDCDHMEDADYRQRVSRLDCSILV